MSVSEIQNAVEEATRKNGAGLEEAAAEVRTRATRARQALQDTARKGAEAAKTQAAAASRRLSQAAQEQPMASLGTTLAVGLFAGFVVGLMVGRATAD
jgi:ElaB/YqjD/DUF883 family membrane-anchored ribosome-binding protein